MSKFDLKGVFFVGKLELAPPPQISLIYSPESGKQFFSRRTLVRVCGEKNPRMHAGSYGYTKWGSGVEGQELYTPIFHIFVYLVPLHSI